MIENRLPDSINRWAWICLLAMACAVHLFSLTTAPLSPDEASQALASLDVGSGIKVSATVNSTLLQLGNMLLFSVFGAGNGMARLLPSLAGIALVCIPLLWRRQLGDVGALTAAVVLLFSPLILFASRRAEGTALSIAAVGCLFSALISERHHDKVYIHNNSILVMLGVCVGLLSGPAFYDMLVAGCLAAVAWYWLRREKITWQHVIHWWQPGLAGVGIALLLSAGLGLRWGQWNGVMDGLALWLASWAVFTDVSHIGALLLYEPLTILLAALGMGYAWQKQAVVPRVVTFWALAVMLLVSVRGGASITSTGAVVFGLAYLSGYGVGQISGTLLRSMSSWVVIHIVLGFICLLPGLVGLTQYANGLISPEQPALVLSGIIVLLALQALLAFLFSAVLPAAILWRSAFLGVAVMCFYIQTGFAVQLSFVRPTSPLEPAVMAAGSRDLFAFKQMMADIAVQNGVREDRLMIAVVDTNPDITTIVRWTLRDYQQLHITSAWPSDADIATMDWVVIAPEDIDLRVVRSSAGWKGMRFTAIERYLAPIPGCQRTTTIDCSDWANWYAYRTSPYPQSPAGLVLWTNN
ncbi:MAG: hypothetical protein P1S60_00595 [Anaerolineae bacterium]|nr:hypothetical protein [Anaerolineae bacterium]